MCFLLTCGSERSTSLLRVCDFAKCWTRVLYNTRCLCCPITSNSPVTKPTSQALKVAPWSLLHMYVVYSGVWSVPVPAGPRFCHPFALLSRCDVQPLPPFHLVCWFSPRVFCCPIHLWPGLSLPGWFGQILLPLAYGGVNGYGTTTGFVSARSPAWSDHDHAGWFSFATSAMCQSR